MTGSKDEGRMTTANEPSVAELVEQLHRAAKEIRTAGYNGWGNTCADAAERLTRLERRCAEMEKAALHLLAWDGRWPKDGVQHVIDEFKALLPPERANEGKAGG